MLSNHIRNQVFAIENIDDAARFQAVSPERHSAFKGLNAACCLTFTQVVQSTFRSCEAGVNVGWSVWESYSKGWAMPLIPLSLPNKLLATLKRLQISAITV